MAAREAGARCSNVGRTRRGLVAGSVAVLTLGTVLAALSISATPALAVIVKIGHHQYGVTPINSARGEAFARTHETRTAKRRSGTHRVRPFDEPPSGGGLLVYHNGPVMQSNTTHVIYWDPKNEFTETTKGIVAKFFADVAHDSGLPSNVFGVDAQYTDKTGNAAYNSTFGGALSDGDAYPANGCSVPLEGDQGPPYTHCLTDEQLQSELRSYVNANSLPKGSTQLYLLLLPHKTVTCFEEEGEECSNNVFCAYHSSIEPGAPNEIIYANIPFTLLDLSEAAFGSPDVKGCQDDGNTGLQQPNPDNAGGSNAETRFADVAVKYISHEFSESITDPLASAWYDEHGLENGDKCNGVTADAAKDGIGYDKNSFLPALGGEASKDNLFDQSIDEGHFYLQSEWDNVAKACRMEPLPITGASFSSLPASPAEGAPVEFKGAATDPYGEPEFAWTFGDGGVGNGKTPVHTYAAAGEYKVTMTPKDARTGSTATPIEHTIDVDEQPSASFTVAPNPADAGAAVEFNGSASKDPDGSIASYAWKFGDTETGSGGKPTHKYKAAGTYEVTLTVEDSSKLTASITHSETVIAEPAVESKPASLQRQTSATANATVTPNGAEVTKCEFEYGTSLTYGQVVPCTTPPGSGLSPVAVSAVIPSLAPNTVYHYRISAKNSVGTAKGNDVEFKTLPAAKATVETNAASAITQTSATLNAMVNPNAGEVESCEFEYGPTASYGQLVPCAALPGSGTSAAAVSASLTTLTANTTYHFRISAKNPGGTEVGTDATFRTLPNAPTVETNAATAITQTSATLNATVDPNAGQVEKCRFEYGTTAAYGSSAPCSSLPGSGMSPVATSAAVSGLLGGTVYHFRISATSPGGTSAGPDRTFATLPTLVMFPPAMIPESSFSALGATVNSTTGAVTFTESVRNAGKFSWLLTFQNGKFGVFAAKNVKCKKGFIKLNGKCRPSTIVFGKGSKVVASPGAVTFTVKPTASALKALKSALKHHKGLPIKATLTFQSSLGGSAVSHTMALTVKLKKK